MDFYSWFSFILWLYLKSEYKSLCFQAAAILYIHSSLILYGLDISILRPHIDYIMEGPQKIDNFTWCNSMEMLSLTFTSPLKIPFIKWTANVVLKFEPNCLIQSENSPKKSTIKKNVSLYLSVIIVACTDKLLVATDRQRYHSGWPVVCGYFKSNCYTFIK
jgi:hypothetical protein